MSRKRTSRSIRLSCDKLWSKVVRLPGICERCGRTEGVLHAHHAYGRSDFRLRFEPRNGCCLCFQCHGWAESFPIDFTHWFRDHRQADHFWLITERTKGPLKRTTSDYLKLEGELRSLLEDESEAA